MIKRLFSVIKRLFSGKMLVFLLVLAGIYGGLSFLSKALAPQGEKAVRAELETSRRERMALDAKISRLSEQLKQMESAGNQEDEVRTNVAVQILKETPIQDILILPAVAEAYDDIQLAAKNDGTLEWLGVKKGATVRKGQPIAKIDAEILDEACKSAEASLTLAEANFKRVSELAANAVASKGELDQARAQRDQARAALAIAKRNLEDTTLLSPIDGRVDDIIPKIGEFVRRGDAVARVVDISIIKMKVHVPEKDIGYFETGQTAQVSKPAPHEGAASGTIRRVRYVADELSKTFLVEAWVDNPDDIFRPGMIAKVSLVRKDHPRALVIPAFAVLPTERGPIVYIEENGAAQARPIEIGIRRGAEFEISKGLQPGDRLIVSGQRNLSSGSLVRVIEE